MNIVSFVPKRDILGRFARPSKKTIAKLVGLVVVVGSFWLNYYLLPQVYNFRCEVNGKTAGYFVRDSVCEELVSDRLENLELSRQIRITKGGEYND